MSTEFKAADFFVLRIPALPANGLEGLRQDFESSETILNNPLIRGELVREAIFLASHNLYRKVYLEDVSALSASDQRKLSLAISKYAFRMSRRCTPFGGFAGVATGRIGDVSRLIVEHPSEWSRVARLDQAIVTKAQSALFSGESRIPSGQLDYELNGTLWRAHDGYRYVEAVRGGAWTHYELSRVMASDAVDEVVALLAGGMMNGSELARRLETRMGAETGAAVPFVESLAANQFIEARPRLAVTGDDVVGSFVDRLGALDYRHPIIDAVSEAHAALNFAATGMPRIEAYQNAVDRLKAIDPDIDASKAIQVDMHARGETLELDASFVQDVLSSLKRLSPLLSRPHRELSTFTADFEKRYGDASVSLLEVLDDDLGISFGGSSKLSTPLVDGLPLNAIATLGRQVEFRDIDAFLLARVQAAAASGDRWLELTDEDLKKFDGRTAQLPETACLLGTVDESLDGARSFHFSGAFGPPVGVLLGRFACGSSVLTDHLRDFAERHESSDDAIFAEFTHLPDGRVGNVILRPVLRKYEIPYLATSGAAEAQQISMDDLEVFCRDGLVHLWSRTLKSRIVPRISNAHNNNNSLNLPVYRFFGALQRQLQPAFGWHWGTILDSLPFLPGVRYRNIVLAKPRWRLFPFEIAELTGNRPEAVAELQSNRAMPSRIRIKQADNFLELDLDHALDRAMFLEEARRNNTLDCEGWSPSHPVASAGSEGHLNEVAIPVIAARPARAFSAPVMMGDRARHTPGTNWLYARIFCGPSVADSWLASEFVDWAKAGLEVGCDRPFFIRYLENGPHIRVRMRGAPDALWGSVRERLEASLQPLLTAGAVSRLEYSTYFPEMHRYGGQASLDTCESIFAEDSLATAAILAQLPSGGAREEARWRWGFRSLFHLVRACDLSSEHELSLLRGFEEGYGTEFRLPLDRRAPLNANYRKHKAFFEGVVSGAITDGDEVFAHRTKLVYHARQSGALQISENNLVLGSLLHMSANRLFPERARAHEFIIFHALIKAMESVSARRRFARLTGRH